MGKILKVAKFTTLMEAVLVGVGLIIILGAVYFIAPGLRTSGSKQLKELVINEENINNITKDTKLSLPSESVSNSLSDVPLIRIAEYGWNGNSGMIVANGGPRTTKGSLMEASKVNLEIVKIDGVSDLRNMMVNFVAEYDKGVAFPKGEKTAFGVSIMGDGVPYFISTTQESLDQKFGKGKYHVQNIGAYGLSYGEDKLIGPKAWKDNPQTMRGALISFVIGDGDWVIAINYAFANKVPVNTDVTTYDADAVNFTSSKDDDYINSVKELIASEKTGFAIELKEVKDGKLTGKTVKKKITGATTWTPGDRLAFDELSGFTDVVSTVDFNNQMATSLVVVKEFALKNDKLIINLLKSTYIASNQIKLYDEWAVRASQAVCKTYNFQTPKYWYDLFKGYKGTKDGLEYNVGGTRVFNYADALQYFGISDGVNRYKSVYEQVSTYLVELNPMGFNESVKGGVVPYDDAVNLYFLKSINDIDAGTTKKADYTADKTTVLASGEWNINFASGSTNIQGSRKDLETIYNLLIQAEDTKLTIVGHTDNTGNSGDNLTLSKGRAEAVVAYLTNKGIPSSRFQLIDGKGDSDPIGDNATTGGKAKNRRVQISLLK